MALEHPERDQVEWTAKREHIPQENPRARKHESASNSWGQSWMRSCRPARAGCISAPAATQIPLHAPP